MDVLAYNIKPVLSLEIEHIAGDIETYYFGYKILELGYYGQLDKVVAYKSGFSSDTQTMREGMKEFQKLIAKLEKENKSNDIPF